MVSTNIRIFPHRTQLDNPLLLALHLQDNRANCHRSLRGLEFNPEGGVGVGHEDALRWADCELGELEEVV